MCDEYEDELSFVAPLKGDGPLARELTRRLIYAGDEIPWRDELVEARYLDWRGER